MYKRHVEHLPAIPRSRTLFFADNAVILIEPLQVLVMIFEVLHEEKRPLRLQVFWAKFTVRMYRDLLNETVQPDQAHGILEGFTYLGGIIHYNDKSHHELMVHWLDPRCH